MERFNRFFKYATAAALLGSAFAGAGCESGKSAVTSNREVMRSYYGVWPDGGTGRPVVRQAAPAPAPAPTPAPAPRPAPAPAPAVAGDALYLPTGERSTSALSIQCQMPREVLANQNFTYDLIVTNLTRNTLINVNVTYTLDGARIVSSDPAASGNSFPLGDLAAGAARTIKITAVASGVGSVRGCSSATWSQALCCGTNVVNPALALVKSVTPADITQCDTVTYTLKVTNSGTGNASNVKITDTLPQGVTTADGRNAVTFDAGNLAAGQSRDFTFQAKAGRTGSFTNNAQATADNGLTAKSNDVAITVRKPVLAITKTCPAKMFIGRQVAYEITVTNTGDGVAAGTVVEDALPAGGSFVSASDGGTVQGGKVVWNVGNLAPTTAKKLSLVLNPGPIASLTNVATARAACADPVTAQCVTAIEGIPAMLLNGSDDPDPIQIGSNVTYTLTITNQGSAPLTNSRLTCTFEDKMEFVSAAGATAGTNQGKTITFAPIPTLAPGARATYTVVIKAAGEGQVQLKAEASSDQITRPLIKTETTNFYR